MSRIKSLIDVDSQEEPDFGPNCDYLPSPEEEEEMYLMNCLYALRGRISASTFALVEKELGFEHSPPQVPYIWKDDGEPLPF